MSRFLAFLQVIIAGVLIFLILLHSGKDAGLSGAFGIGGGGSSFGGGSMVERNLDRATVFFAVLFVVNTLVLLKNLAGAASGRLPATPQNPCDSQAPNDIPASGTCGAPRRERRASRSSSSRCAGRAAARRCRGRAAAG